MPNPGDVIQAIDAATGDLVWEYRRDNPADVTEYVGNLTTNRNIAIYGRHIIDTSVDNHVFALDAETGRLAWETPILDYTRNPARHSSGPIIAGGKVVSGRSCMPRGGPEACVITAHDATTGEETTCGKDTRWPRDQENRTADRQADPKLDSTVKMVLVQGF